MSRKIARRWRLFLDANVLISVAWKEGSKVAGIWAIPDVELVTSDHVLRECMRNLPREEQQRRLERFLLEVRVMEFSAVPAFENPPLLHAKDQPVLAAAVLSRADFLVTGDRTHFGEWFGAAVAGIRVEPPARFLHILEQEQDGFR